MNGVTKFIIGGVVTSLMAMAAHSALGMGNGFVDGLESSARTALGQADGGDTTLAFVRDPALRRFAILSGNADDATKARLLAAVRAVPGVAGARWADDAGAVAVADAPATAAAVGNCQSAVDTAINGQTIQFDSGMASIKPESDTLLTAIATALTPCAGTVVEVGGHTDARGSQATNAALSQARADAVVAALTARNVPAERLTARGYGFSQLKVQSTGAAANAANRRIEFSVAGAGAATPAATPAAGE
jgi:OmpA-OmpF porin, OOP family